MKEKEQHFIQLMVDLVSADNRATQPIRELDGAFAELFDEDERFKDLQYALAMCDGSEENHKVVISECRWALKELTGKESQPPPGN